RAPPITARLDPPPARFAAPRPSAATARASPQLTSTSSSPWRRSGTDTRSGLDEAAKAKRPLSQSHPQLTGSESTPINRVSSPELDWTAVRQPTEQVVQVLSTCSRSQ